MKKKAFTLVELIVVIAIMGIIMAISIPSISENYKIRKEAERSQHQLDVNKSIRQYYALEGEYPRTLDALTTEKFGVTLDNEKYQYKGYSEISKVVEVSLKWW